jgi:hypoxanthine phosphoribosyltransferase
MTTAANQLGEREEKERQDKKTEGKTDWTWICTSNDEKNEILFLFSKVQNTKKKLQSDQFLQFSKFDVKIINTILSLLCKQ